MILFWLTCHCSSTRRPTGKWQEYFTVTLTSKLFLIWALLGIVWFLHKSMNQKICTTNSQQILLILREYLLVRCLCKWWWKRGQATASKSWTQWQMANYWPWTNIWACLKIKIFAENKLTQLLTCDLAQQALPDDIKENSSRSWKSRNI